MRFGRNWSRCAVIRNGEAPAGAASRTVNGAPADLKLSFNPQTQAEVKEFYDASNPFSGGNVVDTRGVLSVVGRGSTGTPAPPPSVGSPATPAALRTGQLSFTTSRGGTLL